MLKDMAQFREDAGVSSPSPTRARQVVWRALAGVAIAVQVILLMGFFALGLG